MNRIVSQQPVGATIPYVMPSASERRGREFAVGRSSARSSSAGSGAFRRLGVGAQQQRRYPDCVFTAIKAHSHTHPPFSFREFLAKKRLICPPIWFKAPVPRQGGRHDAGIVAPTGCWETILFIKLAQTASPGPWAKNSPPLMAPHAGRPQMTSIGVHGLLRSRSRLADWFGRSSVVARVVRSGEAASELSSSILATSRSVRSAGDICLRWVLWSLSVALGCAVGWVRSRSITSVSL